jgi:hypothetical protein
MDAEERDEVSKDKGIGIENAKGKQSHEEHFVGFSGVLHYDANGVRLSGPR